MEFHIELAPQNVVEGSRNSLSNSVNFWNHPIENIDSRVMRAARRGVGRTDARGGCGGNNTPAYSVRCCTLNKFLQTTIRLD